MNNGKACTVAFVLGAVVGSAVTWGVIKKKYEQIANEEIESVKEVFSRKDEPSEPETNTEPEDGIKRAEKPDIKEYAAMLQQKGYTDYAGDAQSEDDAEQLTFEEVIDRDKPYVITPEEFGERDDYDTVSLVYYADDILADDADEIVWDVEGVVGRDSLNHFGEYEDDSVFVRNEQEQTDYEILLDSRNYYDII